MATYYVKTGGDDGNAGISEALAWATPTKAFQTAVAGDTVYFAPGTYRNTSGWSTTNSGSSGSIIKYIGDINCEHFTNENTGYVRLTGCDSSEVPSKSGTVLNSQGSYIEINNLIVDGAVGTSAYALNGYWDADGIIRNNCIFISQSIAAMRGIFNNCIAIGGTIGFGGDTNSCVGIGGSKGSSYGLHSNSIFMGYYGNYHGESYNCVAIGCFRGFEAATNTNCIAFGCYIGFYGGESESCISVCCNSAFQSETITDCKRIYCYTQDTSTTGSSSAANHIGYTAISKIKELAQALKFDLFFEKDNGDDSVSIGTEDILGNPRRQNDGTIDAGPWEFQNREIDWSNYDTNPPGIKLYRKSTELFFLPVKAGEEVTMSVMVKFDATSNKPSLTAIGDSITTQTDTATGDGSSFEELTVTFTPDFDDRIEIRLNANDSTDGDYAIFSDISVS